MKKILITGSNGLLGQSLLDLYLKDTEQYKIIALSRGENRYPIKEGYSYINCDLVDFKELQKIVLKVKPNAIINTAAMTNVDACEEEKEKCDKINIELVKCLTSLSKELKAHLIHISTDFIFDGTTKPVKLLWVIKVKVGGSSTKLINTLYNFKNHISVWKST